jgi:hypothetical protein
MLWCNVTVSIICLIVCIATSNLTQFVHMRGHVESEDQIGEIPRVAPKRQVVPLITLLYRIMFLLITVTCSD